MARHGGSSEGNTLIGNGAVNTLNGLDGDDQLGGGGSDVLTGGTGLDKFVFDTALNASSNVDTVTDFSVGSDTFVLGKAIFSSLAVSDAPLNADAFQAGAGLTHGTDSSKTASSTTPAPAISTTTPMARARVPRCCSPS